MGWDSVRMMHENLERRIRAATARRCVTGALIALPLLSILIQLSFACVEQPEIISIHTVSTHTVRLQEALGSKVMNPLTPCSPSYPAIERVSGGSADHYAHPQTSLQ